MERNGTSETQNHCVVPEYFLTNFVGPADTLDTEILIPLQQNGKPAGPPPNHDWEGKYKFSILFEKEGKLTKTIDWTFSAVTNKLYVNMGTPCPVLFHTAKPPPAGCIIRATPAYPKPQHTSEVVMRCLQHRDPNDITNVGSAEIADHLIRCEAVKAMYHCKPDMQHRSVTIPYTAPAEGMDYICYVYKFMCYCSCTGGGISKRPLQIVFTLEHSGEVLGRRLLDIRICAAPGRDRRFEEEKMSSVKKSLAAKRDGDRNPDNDREKRWKASEDDVYTLQIKGKKNYEILKYLNDLMQFRDLASQIPKANELSD